MLLGHTNNTALKTVKHHNTHRKVLLSIPSQEFHTNISEIPSGYQFTTTTSRDQDNTTGNLVDIVSGIRRHRSGIGQIRNGTQRTHPGLRPGHAPMANLLAVVRRGCHRT